MKVLVDTSIWSIALRNKRQASNNSCLIEKLFDLISDNRATLIGAIRQEILSGIPSHAQFLNLCEKMRAFEDTPLSMEDYEMAAEMYNKCRSKGIQGSHIDFLICSVAKRNHFPIFTSDKDFTHFAKHLDLLLF